MEPRVERAGQGVVRQIFCYTHRQGNCTTGRSSGLRSFYLILFQHWYRSLATSARPSQPGSAQRERLSL